MRFDCHKNILRLTAGQAKSSGDGLQLPPPSPPQEFATMTTPSEAVEIYCVKCKAKTASENIEAIIMKNGRPATRSICVECGTRKFRIGVLP